MQCRSIIVSAIMAAAALVVLSACSGNDYYRRAPYQEDGRTIKASLVRSENQFTDALRTGNAATIANDLTALPKPFARSMAHFVIEYAGHPVATTARRPGDDSTADQILSIGCATEPSRRVDIVWAWFDGAWRAWPSEPDRPEPHC